MFFGMSMKSQQMMTSEEDKVNQCHSVLHEDQCQQSPVKTGKDGKILEAELRTQAVVLETLNTNLYHCQIELQREKTIAGNLEKLFQTKLAEAEEKYKSTIQVLTEENNSLRQKVLTISTNEEIFELRSEKSSSASPNIYES